MVVKYICDRCGKVIQATNVRIIEEKGYFSSDAKLKMIICPECNKEFQKFLGKNHTGEFNI